jgi:hypothetical protein
MMMKLVENGQGTPHFEDLMPPHSAASSLGNNFLRWLCGKVA